MTSSSRLKVVSVDFLEFIYIPVALYKRSNISEIIFASRRDPLQKIRMPSMNNRCLICSNCEILILLEFIALSTSYIDIPNPSTTKII